MGIMPRRKWIIIGVIAAPLIALSVVVAQGLWWYARFSQRLRLADEHAPIVRKALEADGRFSEIHVESFTARNGCLLVEADAPPGTTSQLQAIVAATSPPVPVMYHITELTAATRPASPAAGEHFRE